MMGNKRYRKQMARRIRQETGIPLAAANAIAVKIANYEKWLVTDSPAGKKYARLVDTSGCTCCGPTFKLVVTGPKGSWEHF